MKSSLPQLTAQERAVLTYLAAGRSGNDIAQVLHLSLPELDAIRRSIMRKTDRTTLLSLGQWAGVHLHTLAEKS